MIGTGERYSLAKPCGCLAEYVYDAVAGMFVIVKEEWCSDE